MFIYSMNRDEKIKERILRDKYKFVITHFSNERYNLIFRVFKQVYATDTQLLKKRQFAQCNLQSRVLKNLLIKTGKFSEREIQIKRRFFGLGFHYYLLVNTGRAIWKVDPFFRKFEKQ